MTAGASVIGELGQLRWHDGYTPVGLSRFARLGGLSGKVFFPVFVLSDDPSAAGIWLARRACFTNQMPLPGGLCSGFSGYFCGVGVAGGDFRARGFIVNRRGRLSNVQRGEAKQWRLHEESSSRTSLGVERKGWVTASRCRRIDPQMVQVICGLGRVTS